MLTEPMTPLTIKIRLMVKILHYLKDPKLWELWYIPYYGKNATLRTLNYGNYGIFLLMGNARFCPSAVCRGSKV